MELLGNDIIIKSIKNIIINKVLTHSYLFYGEKGIGKFSFALFFAKSILCPNFILKGCPCFTCKVCLKISKNIHPDIHILKKKDSLRSIHIDDIRSIKTNAFISPNESNYNIFIINNADNMTISAYNALLKILEEPPSNSIFILTAKNKSNIPNTILSRINKFKLSPISKEDIILILKKQFPNLENSKIEIAAHISSGIVGRAIDFLKNVDLSNTYELANSFIENIYSKPEFYNLSFIFNIADDRDKIIEIFNYIKIIIHSRIININLNKLKNYENKLIYTLSTSQLNQIYDIIEDAITKLNSNSNINLTICWVISKINLIKLGGLNDSFTRC